MVEFFRSLPEYLGGPGLAIVAFIDSSFLTLPEVNDALVVWLTILHPSWWAYYAAMTTLGSVVGCYALYLVGRRGGEALLRRRFRQSRIESGLALFRRYGPLVIIVPALLPPPMPFKVFVLLAGAAGIRPGLFLGLVSIGRGLRYGGWALLAYVYGEPAVAFVEEHLAAVAVALGAIAIVGATLALLWRRRRAA